MGGYHSDDMRTADSSAPDEEMDRYTVVFRRSGLSLYRRNINEGRTWWPDGVCGSAVQSYFNALDKICSLI